MELPLFSIAQEALTNIFRHSKSRTATIRLRHHLGWSVLEIEDYGTGIPSHITKGIRTGHRGCENGIGLRGMRERIRELGGRLEIQSSSKGTVIRASVQYLSQAETRSAKVPGRPAPFADKYSLHALGEDRGLEPADGTSEPKGVADPFEA
jgi:signal transduction histidine kinase